MATLHVYTVAVHAIGEDNEGNVAFAAATQEALEAKLLAWHNAIFEDEESADSRFDSFEEMAESEEYSLGFGEDDVEY